MRPPLFNCAIKQRVRNRWGEPIFDLLPLGAQHFLICYHLGRAFLRRSLFLIVSYFTCNFVPVILFPLQCCTRYLISPAILFLFNLISPENLYIFFHFFLRFRAAAWARVQWKPSCSHTWTWTWSPATASSRYAAVTHRTRKS